MRTVAALYIDPRGPYPSMPGVDCWDEKRDARLYDGPWPVVAHPPCGPYSKQRHNYRGKEHDCAPLAIEQVRKFGGVLEHPAGSELWAQCGLPAPVTPRIYRLELAHLCVSGPFDKFGGYTVEVEQVDWGHVARKRTWLYLVGVSCDAVYEACKRPRGTPTHWLSGYRNSPTRKSVAKGSPVPPGIKVCSAQQRRRTPPAFAEWLVSLARMSTVTQPEATCSAS